MFLRKHRYFEEKKKDTSQTISYIYILLNENLNSFLQRYPFNQRMYNNAIYAEISPGIKLNRDERSLSNPLHFILLS